MESSTQIRDMVISHDRILEYLSKASADSQVATAKIMDKLDGIASIANSQNVLSERMQNMETNVREGFDRRDDRLGKVEHTQTNEGCLNVKAALSIAKKNAIAITDLQNTIRDETERVNSKMDSFVSSTLIRWAFPLLVAGITSYATFASVERKDLNKRQVAARLDLREYKVAIKRLNNTVIELSKTIRGTIK